MRNTTLMAGAALAFGMMIAAAPSQASPGVPHVSTNGNYTIQVRDDDDDDHHRRNNRGRLQFRIYGGEHEGRRHHDDEGYQRNSCRSVRHECGDEYGWGSWRFRRCVRHQGC
jgi:hypothetical protein